MGRTLPVPVPCQVCGDKSYGRHYGVYCCDGCSCFFKRSIRKSIAYTCISGDAKCIIDKARRNWCPSCRLKKCINVKMNKNAVQDERGPRKSKKNSQNEAARLIGNRARKIIRSTKSRIPKETHIESLRATEVPMSTLLTSIQQTLQTPLLRFANVENKLAILMRIWPQLFTLYANSIDSRVIASVQQRSAENSSSVNMTTAIRQLLSFGSCLSLDTQEIHIASCLLICSSAIHSSSLLQLIGCKQRFANSNRIDCLATPYAHAVLSPYAEISSITQTNGLEDLYRLMLMYHDKTFYSADPLRSTKVFYYINALKSSVTQEGIIQNFFNQNKIDVVHLVSQACAS